MKKYKLGQLNNKALKNSIMNSITSLGLQHLITYVNLRFRGFICVLALILSTQVVIGQAEEVSVYVEDGSGLPLEGVIIQSMDNFSELVKTDESGVATLNILVNGLIKLTLGDMEETVLVKTKKVKVQLNNSDKRVNLGFGLSKSVDETTSSIDVVYSDELEKSSLNNPLESLYGQLTGLMVLQNGGEPWNRNPSINIRGRGTLNNNSVLVIVDGFERNLSTLALLDIESVSVLKDGTALARYGQRGANGVILVTTKRGNKGSLKAEFTIDQGWNFAFREPEFLNSYDYARAVNQASILDGNAPVYSDQDLFGFQSNEDPFLLPNVNWFDETFRDFGNTTNISGRFSGGSKTLKYFASVNYQNERGLFDNTNFDNRYDSQLKYDRFNFRTNIDLDVTNTTKFILNATGYIDGRTVPGAQVSGIMNALYRIPSAAFPVRTPNGEFGGTEFYDNNPVALVSSTGVRQPNGRQIMVDGQIIQDLSGLVKGLSAELALAYDNQVVYTENRIREFLYESLSFLRDPLTGEIIDSFATVFGSETDLNFSSGFGDQVRHATLYGKLNYDKIWGNHKLNASLMYHQDKRVNDGQYNTFLHQNSMVSASYGYKNRYFIDHVLSYAGSSVLPDGDRFGFFPAFSAGWIVNRENFLKDSKTIDYLKLRLSWGISGNDSMNYNLAEQAFGGGGGYYFTSNNNSSGGISEGRLATVGLTYENSIKTNIGIDLKLLGGLSMTADVFYDKRENILIGTGGAIPSLIGVTTAIENAGEVKSQGLETSLLWKKEVGDFKYFIGGNFTFAKNEIVEMNEEFQPYDYLRETGNPVGQQFGLESLGFFQNQADIDNSPQQLFSEVRPGDIKYKDQNGDGVIDNLDVVPIGYAGGYPEIYYGINFGYEMKGFGVDILFQGIANQTIYLNTPSVFWPLRGNATLSDFSANSWTPETAQTATLPRLSLLENNNNFRRNDIWLTRGDYLKLRRFEIYYNFPDHLVSKLAIKKAKLYGRGMNVLSFDAIRDADPEAIGIGYPTLASYHLGLKIEF
ncbi:SusC/RagA family TonB-linked outer membrane protein [Aestuariivivens sediminicola]|uniref:SusC/RagA family TonB-linked outer membrane protein n=2 Tax=Aestuariivivens TaxID=1820275 RepID=UPI001F591078|nr:SusC/RagA family TonB-linked outer membrane protein [Aestuariivivens sediminicola]